MLVGISVFVEDSNSLLPMLGRSANLSEPWAPRKDTSRRFVFFTEMLQNIEQFNICAVYILSDYLVKPIEFELLALECGAPPRRP